MDQPTATERGGESVISREACLKLVDTHRTDALKERSAGNGIQILDGATLKRFLQANVAVDLPSINAGAGLHQVVTVTGVVAGDVVVVCPPSTGPGGTANGLIVGVGWGSAADEVTFGVFNASGAAINATNRSYRFLVFGF